MVLTKEDLDVTKEDISKAYKNMTDVELNSEIAKRFNLTAKLKYKQRWDFLYLLRGVNFTRKQSLLFLEKFNTSNQMIGYFHRHLIRCAYFYNVPTTIINNYIRTKETYNFYKSSLYSDRNSENKLALEYKRKMQKESRLLMKCTLEMINKSASRKSKIENIINKITDKEN